MDEDRSYKDNGGFNPGLGCCSFTGQADDEEKARDAMIYRCESPLWTFSVTQDDLGAEANAKANIVLYDDFLKKQKNWNIQAIDWSSILHAHLNNKGVMSRSGLEELFGEKRTTIKGEMMTLVLNRIRSMSVEYQSTHKVKEGKTRPKIGLGSMSMVICGCTFSSPEEYNDHFRQVHGVTTEARLRQAPAAPSAPLLIPEPD